MVLEGQAGQEAQVMEEVQARQEGQAGPRASQVPAWGAPVGGMVLEGLSRGEMRSDLRFRSIHHSASS